MPRIALRARCALLVRVTNLAPPRPASAVSRTRPWLSSTASQRSAVACGTMAARHARAVEVFCPRCSRTNMSRSMDQAGSPSSSRGKERARTFRRRSSSSAHMTSLSSDGTLRSRDVSPDGRDRARPASSGTAALGNKLGSDEQDVAENLASGTSTGLLLCGCGSPPVPHEQESAIGPFCLTSKFLHKAPQVCPQLLSNCKSARARLLHGNGRTVYQAPCLFEKCGLEAMAQG